MKVFNYKSHENIETYCLPSFFVLHQKYNLSEKKVLDVATGPGQYLKYFGKNSCAIEISSPNIELIKERGFRVIKVDLNKYPYPIREKFDVVFASHIIEHLYSPILFIKELEKLIKNDGLIIIGYPSRFSLVRLFSPYFDLKEIQHFYDFSLTGMKVLLKANNLRIVDIVYDMPLVGRLPISRPLLSVIQKLPYLVVSWWSANLWIVAKKIGRI